MNKLKFILTRIMSIKSDWKWFDYQRELELGLWPHKNPLFKDTEINNSEVTK